MIDALHLEYWKYVFIIDNSVNYDKPLTALFRSNHFIVAQGPTTFLVHYMYGSYYLGIL